MRSPCGQLPGNGLRRGPGGRFSSVEDTEKTHGRRPCSPSPSQPRLLFTCPSLGSGCELVTASMLPCSCLAQTPPNALMLQPLATRPRPPSALVSL